MAYIDQLPEAGTASMARDLSSGRRSELEAWNGAVARIGKEVGVATPVHDFIYASPPPTELRARNEHRQIVNLSDYSADCIARSASDELRHNEGRGKRCIMIKMSVR